MVEKHSRNGGITALLERGDAEGCLELSEVEGLAEALELDEDETASLLEEIEGRGIEVRDDCGRPLAAATFVNGHLAAATTDALQLFPDIDGGDGPLSVEEIGRRLDLRRERVRELEEKALERLAMEREIAALEDAA